MSTVFNPARVTREDLVEQSVFDFVKAAIAARGFPSSMIDYRESFQTNLFVGKIDKSYVCAGFHQNDGGRLAELGSNLRVKNYNFEYWVVGLDHAQGRNLAHAISETIEKELVIPILDFTRPGHPPTGDVLLSAENPCKVDKAIVADPQPWQEFLYQVQVMVTDWFYL